MGNDTFRASGLGRARAVRIGLGAALLGTLTLSGGCAGTPGKGGATVTIDTTPPGATALADGRRLGVTPLTVVRDDAFPPHWRNMEYRVSGTLTLRKAGCRPVQMPVSDPVLSKPIHVSLDCKPGAAGTSAPADTGTRASPPPGGSADSTARRLQRLRRLHDQGLVTDREYRQIRQRILDSL